MRGVLKSVAGVVVATALLGSITACAGQAGQADSVSAAGVWGTAKSPGEPSLDLASDGKLTGSDGCNTLAGTWTEDDNGVVFGPVAATKMFCEGVDDWLSSMATATVSGDSLTVFDGEGAEIGQLTRPG